MKGNSSLRTYLIGSVAAIAGLLFGFDTGVISGAQTFIFETFGIHGNDVRTNALKGFVVAVVPLGAFFGALMSGFCAQALGRRKSLLYTALIFVVGTLTTALALHIDWVIFGRLLMGIAIGISAMIAPMYLSEISPPDVRGAIIFLFQLAITLGLLGSFTANLVFVQWIPDHEMNWRWMFGVGIVPSAILFLGMLKMPYSPRWLVLKKRDQEAEATLKKLLGKEDIHTELDEIHESVTREGGSLKDLFSGKLFPLLAMAFALFVFQQLSGINAIMYYGPAVFAEAGLGETGKFLAQVLMGTVNVVMTVVGVWVVDKCGRRPLLFIGFTGMIACLTTIGSLLQTTNGVHGASTYGAIASILFFIGFFAISLGGVPYIIMSEVFPLKVRASGMAIASCANWAFNMLVSETFDILRSTLGMGNTFFLYAGCTIVGLLFAWRFVPETKNRPLEEIEQNLYAGKPLRLLGKSPETNHAS
ncbi:MAG TPA: MFS transporter [Opitutae bacterium]|nr:MFS transporter [Opitutae bacterium]|tara:strand:+ start:3991 stop:5412 length:1422 start_codon:yes stop_codon:yes gene_type:complete